MTPHQFIRKWKHVALTERAAAQSHFLDLCALFGHDDPVSADPVGEWFTFEKGATKTGGGEGFADVWKRNHFAWEYKRRKSSLEAALEQLVRYASALENPPLQVACDTDRFVIRTAWTNAVPVEHRLTLEQLETPEHFATLRAVFFDPERLRPTTTRATVTREAADKFSTVALRLQGRETPENVAHFVNQLVFCFFATSIKLLPEELLPKLLKRVAQKAERAQGYLNQLFAAMESGGEFDLTDIAHFNGGLFDGRRALRLDEGDIGLLRAAASLDWGQIDPTIFGTLFERFLDPGKRAQIGAHYTDPDKIMKLVEPVILRPLRAEWVAARAEIEALLDGSKRPPMRSSTRRRMSPVEAAEEVRSRFLERLQRVSILDPACGSGNFLYLALQGVKDVENRANLEAEALGLAPRALLIGPEILRGIEVNSVAAELARTTVWIGDIQWRRRNGIYVEPPPILRKLDAIQRCDALIIEDAAEPTQRRWPDAEFIVGNPPFLGGKLMRTQLGDGAVDRLFAVYADRVPAEADLVTYWFEKARANVAAGLTKRVGFVATNSMRGGANRRVLDRIVEHSRVFEAWSDEPWIVDGANVRVSLVCFGEGDDAALLDGRPASRINADLTAGALDLTKARRLDENLGVAFMGDTKGGAFDVKGELARAWLRLPLNPNGRLNADVLRPWRNGLDVTRRSRDMWIVDFGTEMSEREASLFEAPFEYVREHVLPKRATNRREAYRERWWRHVEPRPALVTKLRRMGRYIATPRNGTHRLFVWLDSKVVPDSQVIVITSEDDFVFGLLQSRFHRKWSLRLGSWLGVGNDPRYTPTTTFETFPFPEGLTPDVPAAEAAGRPPATTIAEAARRLDELRERWLNPPDLVVTEPEVAPGFPDRTLPKNTEAAALLRGRTLTNLYNEWPQWLADAHRDLDAAVATAYGWPADIPDEDALQELLDLNLARAGSPNISEDQPHVIDRHAFEAISAVEGVRLSEPAKRFLADLDAEGVSPEEARRRIVERLPQLTPAADV